MPIVSPPDPSARNPTEADIAARLAARLWLAGKVVGALGLYAGVAAAVLHGGYLTQWLALLGAALLLVAAALFDRGRMHVAATPGRAVAPVWTWVVRRLPDAYWARLRERYAEYRDGARALLLAGAALAALMQAWWSSTNTIAFMLPGAALLNTIALVGMVCAVILIVVERWVAALESRRLPGAAALARMLRIPIVVCAVGGLAIFAAAQGQVWMGSALRLMALAVGLVAVEVGLRAAASWYDPRRFGDTVKSEDMPPLVDSALIAALRPGMSPWRMLCEFGVRRFGVDLRQNRGLRFMARAAPVFILMSMMMAYALSALTELQPNQRGVYERFGRPVAVWQPGLHLGLPWPFGRVVRVENGVLHEVAVVPPTEAAPTSIHAAHAVPDNAIDPMPPDSANRLWDSTHAFDSTQVIAGQSTERESFQVMNVDARFVYRVGPSDADALAASYQVADVPGLLRDIAGRALIRQFSSDTLSAILGEPQDQMAKDLKHTVQAGLDRLHSGIQLVAVVIEAIHPPGGAAGAYHEVQAAELTAQALIFEQQGQAAQTLSEAQQAATVSLDGATGDAAQTIADARATAQGFTAAQTAYRDAGNIFLREAYLHALDRSLPRAQLVIVDHRIADAGRATIDLRGYGNGSPDLIGAMHNTGEAHPH